MLSYLHGGSLEITLTIPLNYIIIYFFLFEELKIPLFYEKRIKRF